MNKNNPIFLLLDIAYQYGFIYWQEADENFVEEFDKWWE